MADQTSAAITYGSAHTPGHALVVCGAPTQVGEISVRRRPAKPLRRFAPVLSAPDARVVVADRRFRIAGG
jgi:hypothetical protein